jgi:HAE1 family hydrophobic/amphiphilic exporter-1
VLAVFFATVVASVWLYREIPKDFLPSGDSGQIIAYTEGAPDASFDSMVQRQRPVAAIAANNPNIETFMSVVGSGGSRITPNTGIMLFKLKPTHGVANPRTLTPDELIQELRPKLSSVPGIKVSLQNPPPIRLGGQISSGAYQYTLQDTDLEELYKWTDTLMTRMRKLPGFVDVNSNLNNKSPVMALDVDRDKLAALGLDSARWRTPCKAPSARARSPPSMGPPTSTR